MEQEARLEAADILLIRGRGPLRRMARYLSRFAGADRIVDRVDLVVRGGGIDEALVLTSGNGHSHERLVDRYGGKKLDVAVYRATSLAENDRRRVIDAAQALKARKPGQVERLAGIADRLLNGVYLFRWLVGGERRCLRSWPVAEAFAERGIDFGASPKRATPDCIRNWMMSRKKQFWKLRDLWPVEVPAEEPGESLAERVAMSH